MKLPIDIIKYIVEFTNDTKTYLHCRLLCKNINLDYLNIYNNNKLLYSLKKNNDEFSFKFINDDDFEEIILKNRKFLIVKKNEKLKYKKLKNKIIKYEKFKYEKFKYEIDINLCIII